MDWRADPCDCEAQQALQTAWPTSSIEAPGEVSSSSIKKYQMSPPLNYTAHSIAQITEGNQVLVIAHSLADLTLSVANTTG
eukprot:1159301-Pelagomonas_calceolata.AAC.8